VTDRLVEADRKGLWLYRGAIPVEDFNPAPTKEVRPGSTDLDKLFMSDPGFPDWFPEKRRMRKFLSQRLWTE
jgi:hypothetical protein